MPLRNGWWWFYSFTAHQVDGCQILLFLKQHLTIAFKSFCTFLTSERNGTRMARWKGKTPFLNTFKNLDLTSLQYSPFSQRVITIAFYWESISPAVGPVPVGLIYQSSSMVASRYLAAILQLLHVIRKQNIRKLRWNRVQSDIWGRAS